MCGVGGAGPNNTRGPVCGASSGRLKQEASEEEKADDDGERDENDFDESETHGRILRVCAPLLVQGRHSIGAWSDVSTFEPCVIETPEVCHFPLKIREKGGAGSVRRKSGQSARRLASSKQTLVL